MDYRSKTLLSANPQQPARHEVARTVNDRAPEPIDPAHRAAVEAGLADMRAGRIASPAEIEAVYARFGRGAR